MRIIKLGGSLLSDASKRKYLISQLASERGEQIIVHGGGNSATELAARLGLETKKVDGRRITDSATLEVVQLSFSALNKQLSSELSFLGVPAVGLSGGDFKLIPSKKREHPEIDFGFVGDVETSSINTKRLLQLLELGITPVISALTQDISTGILLNTNADTIAQELATALSPFRKTELIFLFDLPGVMRDIDDPKSLISTIYIDEIEKLVGDKIIVDGMIPKLANAKSAIQNGVSRVRIANYKDILGGTLICKKT